MTEFDSSDLSSMEPAEFAQKVKSASPAQLNDMMSGDSRRKILDTIFNRFPNQFRADRAGTTNAVLHWNITGRPDGGADTYEVVIANGTCTLSPSPTEEPKLSVSVDGPEFLKLVTGSANPMMMFMTGKLKAKGDLGLAANLANLFDLPKG